MPHRSHFDRPFGNRARLIAAFTLVELLVVIGIIALLIAILVPAVSHIRTSGYEASTRAQLQTIAAAIEQYHNSFNAYPGPIANKDLVGGSSGKNYCTGTENLVLALMGGINPASVATTGFPASMKLGSSGYFINYGEIGQGPLNLNPAKVQRYPALIEAKTGHLQDQSGWNKQGIDVLAAYGNVGNPWKASGVSVLAPVFLDRFPDPLPILYIRANVGASGVTGTTAQYNVTELAAFNMPERNQQRLQYAYSQNGSDPYVIGAPAAGSLKPSPSVAGKSLNDYFWNPSSSTSSTSTIAPYPAPYQKDGYILISAGRDRVFGSLDDLDSFGSPK